MFVRWFSTIRKDDAAIAGGKGASLGEMTQADIPVPPGFVVLATAFERFLQETQLHAEIDAILHQVKHQEMASVEKAAAEIKALILNVEMSTDIAEEIRQAFSKLGSEFVAVRSSATAEDSASAAWAGQLDTFLNTTEEQLIERVQHCWASLFTPRAIFYRFEKNLHEQHISVAVVVQTMVQSEISGIAFSVHPVSEDPNQLIIESAYGLGEAIVSGQITPDSFVVEKDSLKIVEKNITTQQKILTRSAAGGNEWQQIAPEQGALPSLSDAQVIALARLIVTIEQHYGFPVDVEWARAQGKWHITQSRPITTLKRSFQTQVKRKPIDLIFTRDFGLATADLWRELLRNILPTTGGKGISDQIVHYEHGRERYFRLSEDIASLREHTLSLPLEEPLFSATSAKLFRKNVDALRALMAAPLRNSNLAKSFHEADALLREAYPWYMLSIFVPGPWAEEFKKRHGSAAENLIALQFKNRVYSEGLLKEFSVFQRKIIGMLLEQRKIPAKFANVVRYTEALALFERQAPRKEDLEKRAKGYVLINNEIITGKDFTTLLNEHHLQFEEAKITELSELRGTPAFRAKPVQGIVRLVFTSEEIANFPEGDIL
ncbi:MAG TPA: PEP/pyruvate-binding domain-containing protein, partial [Candidatus Nanoarchaeia archaeon]|nr:PEP/pyruvate-binding domain-containing protein [Candidatus Nanoarchaeia archaeon]